MKIIRGIKLGGLQQKIFNLMLIFIVALVGAFVAVSLYQQNNLGGIVEEANTEQQASIADVSESTMETVLETSMTRTTALQAYIADDLFGDVRTEVQTLGAFATELFAHAELFPGHPFSPPLAEKDGGPGVVWSRVPYRVLLGAIFGAFCAVSDYIGIQVKGAIPNARVIGILSAGLLGGPVSGMLAAAVGAVHRYLVFPPRASTRRGYWWVAKTVVINTALSNGRLERDGFKFFSSYYRSVCA